ncbi:uncharacterized protein LOC132551670 [Ylistrum balloti]|uniref:uncharacterized protein LOC132551670 n=1 Tax=Ylistrum balloti TaxID=509963 RepID=UPI002905D775|nr:uncharacterized protein LOC132551670 [Ylistrum balloti]
MDLKPSEIRFTQNSINNVFDKNSRHDCQHIGETLDSLLMGRCEISDIPTITVINRNSAWYTVDNRRLWVFQKLEELGKCTEIPVIKGFSIPAKKLTTNNDGRSVRVRGNEGGSYWRIRSLRSTLTPHRESRTFGDQSLPNYYSVERTPSASSFSESSIYNGDQYSDYRPIRSLFAPVNRPSTPASSSRPSTASFPAFLQTNTFSGRSSVELLDPEKVRYTKEKIKAPPRGLGYRSTDPILVYRAFEENWTLDGNRRLWSYKEARKYDPFLKVRANVKDDEDEFLEKLRVDRPWLTVLDIVQMGETVTIE